MTEEDSFEENWNVPILVVLLLYIDMNWIFDLLGLLVLELRMLGPAADNSHK